MPSSARTILSALTALLPSPAAGCGLLLGRRAVGQDRHVLAVVTAMRTHRMRPLQLTAILALEIGHRGQRMMGPAHVAAGLGHFLLGNGHDDLHAGVAPLWYRPQKTSAA